MPVGVYHYPQSLPVLNVCTFSKLNSDNLYLEHILLLFWWVLCCIRIRGLCFYLALYTFVGVCICICVCICQAGARSSIGSTCLGHKFFPLCWKRGAGCPLRGGVSIQKDSIEEFLQLTKLDKSTFKSCSCCHRLTFGQGMALTIIVLQINITTAIHLSV